MKIDSTVSRIGRFTPWRARVQVMIAIILTAVIFWLWIGGFILPFSKWVRARSWVEQPCVIEELSFNSAKNKASVVVRFNYEWQAKRFTGSEYSVMAGYQEREDVSHLSPGSEATCFVNPRNPAEAVIDRSLAPWLGMGIAGVLLTLFTLASALGTIRLIAAVFVIQKRRRIAIHL